MNKLILVFIVAFSFALHSFRTLQEPSIIEFVAPLKWPSPNYDFKKNPITKEGFELGRKLFYDPILSRDNSISCASCHLQYTGFTHIDHAVSHGIEGRKGTRNSPALINLAWQKFFHWDGGVNHIEVQGLNPIKHPAEMDNTLENVISKLSASDSYKHLFLRAFGTTEISVPRIMKALSMFTLSLVSSDSKYDQVMRREKGIQYTDQEKRGYKIFRQNCAVCHSEPLLSKNLFASNGLPVDTLLNDSGRYAITGLSKDSLQFKIPTLRNIEVTFPYMHDGRFKKLKDVINYYSDGIDPSNPYKSKELKGPFHFSEHEKKDLLAFLLTLTDRTFLYNQEFSFPK